MDSHRDQDSEAKKEARVSRVLFWGLLLSPSMALPWPMLAHPLGPGIIIMKKTPTCKRLRTFFEIVSSFIQQMLNNSPHAEYSFRGLEPQQRTKHKDSDSHDFTL